MGRKESWYRTFLYEDFTLAMAVPIVLLNTAEAIYIIKKKLKSRNKKSSLLILSLCISDLLLGINMIILKSMHRFMKTTLKGNSGAELVYDVIKFGCIRLAYIVSILNLTLITFDRCFAVTQPMTHRSHRTRTFFMAVIVVWVIGLVITAVLFFLFKFAFNEKGDIQKMNLVFSIPTFFILGIFMYCYGRIYSSVISSGKEVAQNDARCEGNMSNEKVTEKKIAKKDEFSSIQMENTASTEAASTSTPQNGTKKEKKAKKEKVQKERKTMADQHRERESRLLKLAVSKVVVFFICWFPLAILSCFVAAKYSYPKEKEIRTTFFVLANMNAFWNPIVYYINVRKGP